MQRAEAEYFLDEADIHPVSVYHNKICVYQILDDACGLAKNDPGAMHSPCKLPGMPPEVYNCANYTDDLPESPLG